MPSQYDEQVLSWKFYKSLQLEQSFHSPDLYEPSPWLLSSHVFIVWRKKQNLGPALQHPASLSPSSALTLSFLAPATLISELLLTGPWHGLFSLPNSFLYPPLLLFQVKLAQSSLSQKSFSGLPDEVDSPVTSSVGPCISSTTFCATTHLSNYVSLLQEIGCFNKPTKGSVHCSQ